MSGASFMPRFPADYIGLCSEHADGIICSQCLGRFQADIDSFSLHSFFHSTPVLSLFLMITGVYGFV